MEHYTRVKPSDSRSSEENALIDSESDEDSELAKKKQKERKTFGLCFWIACCFCCTILVAILTVLFTCIALNSYAKRTITSEGAHILGVPVTVDNVRINIFSSWSRLLRIAVHHPVGYTKDFLDIDNCIFRLRGWSAFSKPYKLQEMTFHGVSVAMEQQSSSPETNVNVIMDNIQRIIGSPSGQGLRGFNSKFIVDVMEFKDLNFTIFVHPLSDALAPAIFHIKRIIIRDVGKVQHGVYLSELLGIVVQAILAAVERAAPSQAQDNIRRGIGAGINHAFDVGAMHFDKGQGLVGFGMAISNFAGRLGNKTQQMGDRLANGIKRTSGHIPVAKTAGQKVAGMIHNASHKIGQAFGKFGHMMHNAAHRMEERFDKAAAAAT